MDVTSRGVVVTTRVPVATVIVLSFGTVLVYDRVEDTCRSQHPLHRLHCNSPSTNYPPNTVVVGVDVKVYVTVSRNVTVSCGAHSREKARWYANGGPTLLFPSTRIDQSPDVIWLFLIGHVVKIEVSSGTVSVKLHSCCAPVWSLTRSVYETLTRQSVEVIWRRRSVGLEQPGWRGRLRRTVVVAALELRHEGEIGVGPRIDEVGASVGEVDAEAVTGGVGACLLV